MNGLDFFNLAESRRQEMLNSSLDSIIAGLTQTETEPTMNSLSLTISDDDIRGWSKFGSLSAEPAGFMPFELEPVQTPTTSASLIADIESLTDLNDFSGFVPGSEIGDAQNPTQALNQGNALWADFLSQAREEKKTATMLNLVADAGDLFDSIVGVSAGISNAKATARNTIMSAENQITAIDNQTMYVKSRLQNRFNNMLAQTQVRQSARGLKVSAASTLEENKERAYDLTMDYATLDSNANLEKIRLENTKAQAKVAEDFTKNQTWANLLGSLNAFAFSVGTADWKTLLDKNSLAKSVYGSK